MSSKGILYGAARNGGSSGMGTLFSLTSAGKITVLHTFSGSTDGANPVAGLLFTTSTPLYGAASLGGAHGDGTFVVLHLTAATPAFKLLHAFDGTMQSANFAPKLLAGKYFREALRAVTRLSPAMRC